MADAAVEAYNKMVEGITAWENDFASSINNTMDRFGELASEGNVSFQDLTKAIRDSQKEMMTFGNLSQRILRIGGKEPRPFIQAMTEMGTDAIPIMTAALSRGKKGVEQIVGSFNRGQGARTLSPTSSRTRCSPRCVASPPGSRRGWRRLASRCPERWSGLRGRARRRRRRPTRDANFWLSSLSAPGISITYGYDNDGLLTSATVGSDTLTLARRSDSGLLEGSTVGSAADAWDHNGFAEPLSYSAKYGRHGSFLGRLRPRLARSY